MNATLKFNVALIVILLVQAGTASTFVDFCSGNQIQATPLPFKDGLRHPLEDAFGQPLEGALLGTDTTAVVLSNDSGNSACSWFPFAQTPADDGFRVLLYPYASYNPGDDRLDDLHNAIAALPRLGIKHVVLVGASQGANLTLIASSQAPPGVEAAVTLSTEGRVLASQGEALTPFATQVTLPLFMITEKKAPYGSDEATPRLYKLAPAEDKKLLVVPGYVHGTDLLGDPGVSENVLDFIRRHQ